jgi:putative oxidoreductase
MRYGTFSTSSNNWLLLFARLALAAIYVPSGFSKVTHLSAFAQSLATRGVPGSSFVAILGACVEFFGAVAVVIGLKTRWVALLMALFTVVAAFVSHRFWDAQESVRAMQYIQFMKNVAITGGFLALFVAGSGRYSVDRWID